MTWGVDEVDFDVLPSGADVFGQDCDAALSFEIVVVEDEFTRFLALVDDIALVDDFVDQGCFPVVDVGDDGHVADSAHEVGVCGRKGRSPVNSLVQRVVQNFEPLEMPLR